MAFTSLNGTVDVTLPPTTKANLRLRSDNGDVYSDFDVQLAPSAPPMVQESRSSNGRYRISRNRSIVGAINGGGPEFELRTFNSNVYVRKGQVSRITLHMIARSRRGTCSRAGRSRCRRAPSTHRTRRPACFPRALRRSGRA